MPRAPLAPYADLLVRARAEVQTNPQISTRQFQVMAGGSAQRTGDALRAAKIEAGLALREEAGTLPAELRALLHELPAAGMDMTPVEEQLAPVRTHLESAMQTVESVVLRVRDQYAEDMRAAEARLSQELTDAREHMARTRERVAELERELAETRTEAAETRELAARREHDLTTRTATLQASVAAEKAARDAAESGRAILTDEVKSLQGGLEASRGHVIRLTAEREALERQAHAAEAHAEQLRVETREARDEAKAAHSETHKAAALAAAAEERARQQALAAEERGRVAHAAHEREIAALREQIVRLEATVVALKASGNEKQKGTDKLDAKHRA